MITQKQIGLIGIVIGIILILAVLYGNYLFLNAPYIYDDRTPWVTDEYLDQQAKGISGYFKEEVVRTGAKNTSEMPMLQFMSAMSIIPIQWQLSNIARFILAGLDFILLAQAAMLILWGAQKFTKK
jgi:hypothetical protein